MLRKVLRKVLTSPNKLLRAKVTLLAMKGSEKSNSSVFFDLGISLKMNQFEGLTAVNISFSLQFYSQISMFSHILQAFMRTAAFQ